MGFTSGVSSTSFGAGTQLNREQAATMLSAVYRKLGGTIPPQEAAPFSDRGSISALGQGQRVLRSLQGRYLRL